ncbi:hypothetical protein ACS0TY_018750 [Phlomoides rotata]
MALSYYSNWDSFQQLDSEFSFCETELQSFHDPWNYDYFYEPTDLFHYENPNSFISNGAEFEPPQFHYQKRQKGFDFDHQFYSEADHFNYPAAFSLPNPCLLQDYPLPEIALPELPAPPPYAAGSVKAGGGGSLSAQSIAARQRRRKITEKTQELGKLVPGGQKMNTAEMLQSAYKYIKFLQAQVSLLGFISSSHQENGVEFSEEFQHLVESPLIQEKLYSSENCLVPQGFVEELSSENETFKSNSHLIPPVKKEH